MVICFLDALRKSSKKKKARIKKETFKVLQQAITLERYRVDEILGFDLGFVG